ncbi:UNKNOWN [Stylonychia lemnae]|uniref:Uncharacterized protein n=1 Tax=Stylonychia lemnae TaxID=5949 RepID=A0A078ABR2_STYLE|nr:UNKNOWN [Stylonychia lemnae]|eukprot:CDW78218.1 UNKNOWN [Stylonychia lemnae]
MKRQSLITSDQNQQQRRILIQISIMDSQVNTIQSLTLLFVEKIRIKSKVEILSYLDEITANRFLVEQVWNQLSDEERLVYKRPLPGLDKQEIKDELQHYEPQIEDLIPRNFKVVKLICHDFDHFMMAPPPVIADQRRKPQQYESLAQPFKKDRRFRHQFDEQTKEWFTKELVLPIDPNLKIYVNHLSGKRQSVSGYWASSNVDEEEKQPGLRDKKYEGYSNLKGSHEQLQKKSMRKQENQLAKNLEEEYILNMQKQVVLMEHEIKLLKDREVDQKNKASGYETLLRDGIPLNEHFLALKNKYNNEKDDMDKYCNALQDEIKREEMNNKNKKHKIEILRREYEEINTRFQIYKDQTQKQMRDLETRLYNERHTKAILEGERGIATKKLADVKNLNQQMSREIQRNKMFNKKDEDRKNKKEINDKSQFIIREQNKNIEDNDIKLDQERRRNEDKQLVKKQQEATMALKQDNNKVHIDISIAQSRLKDLEGLKEMTMAQLKDIISEKRQVDQENESIDHKIQGRGVSEQEARAKQFEAEREQMKKISNSLKFQKELATILMEKLKDEETKAKDMLDEKIRQNQLLNQNLEDQSEARAISQRNREEIIKLQIRLSQLRSQEERMKIDFEKYKIDNDYNIKTNKELEDKNRKLDEEIKRTIQRIDINVLLKNVDIEDMRIIAQNNKQMSAVLNSLINKWEVIQTVEISSIDIKM